jgi:hypothetical protein
VLSLLSAYQSQRVYDPCVVSPAVCARYCQDSACGGCSVSSTGCPLLVLAPLAARGGLAILYVLPCRRFAWGRSGGSGWLLLLWGRVCLLGRDLSSRGMGGRYLFWTGRYLLGAVTHQHNESGHVSAVSRVAWVHDVWGCPTPAPDVSTSQVGCHRADMCECAAVTDPGLCTRGWAGEREQCGLGS